MGTAVTLTCNGNPSAQNLSDQYNMMDEGQDSHPYNHTRQIIGAHAVGINYEQIHSEPALLSDNNR
jgi:hypothetical protein